MDHHKLQKLTFFCIIFFMLCFLSIVALAKQKNLSATIIDTKGKEYKVTNFKAKYRASGTWIGRTPTSIRETFYITLTVIEDRITTTEKLELPFTSMIRIVLKDVIIPDNLNKFFKRGRPILIEKRDGSSILLSNKLLIEVDTQGNQKKKLNIDRYSLKIGKGGHYLTGFMGKARTKSGKVGDFWIKDREVKIIKFVNP